MSNWQKSKVYCCGCRRWKIGGEHKNCPESGWFKGSPGQTVIDLENSQMGCVKCKQVWPLENNVLYCPCGHVQNTYYTDSAVILEANDEIIWSEGNMVYVLKESGAVVVGYREFPHFTSAY